MKTLRENGLRWVWVLLVLLAAVGLGFSAHAARGETADGGAWESDAWRKGLGLTSPVMDWAGVLPRERKAALEAAIAAGTASNGAQLVVASLPSLKGGEIGDFAVKLFEQWEIGEKGKDNGVLLLLALEERQVDIEVGYGFEGALPDAVCGRIRDEAIIPRCKEGDYAAALEDGAAALLKVMAGETFAERKKSNAGLWIFLVIFVGFVGLVVWSACKGGGGEGSGDEESLAPVKSSHRSPARSHVRTVGGARRSGGGARGGGFHGRGGRSGGGGARGGW
jgi:uncharacterized protein